MKFGIWISAADRASLISRAAEARDAGFDGVGVRRADLIHDSLAPLPLPVACVEGGLVFTDRTEWKPSALESVRDVCAMARALASPMVHARAAAFGRRTSQTDAVLASLLIAGADEAQRTGLRLVIDNPPERPLARDLWALLDRCNHPALAACLDATAAARAGEGPAISVPVLNSRIALVSVDLDSTGDGFEQGDLAVEDLIHRLRGIGYGGCLLLQGADDNLAPAKQLLARLQKWNQRPTPARKHGPHPVAAKPGAVPASNVEQTKTPASAAGA